MHVSSVSLASVCLVALLTALAAAAEEAVQAELVLAAPPAASLEKATLAKMRTAILPVYPLAQQQSGQEGWVILSFVVSPDGKVLDPIVEESNGVASFERAALKAAAAQRYTPATRDGKPVEQCATQVRYMFSIAGMPRGARRDFSVKYKKIRSMIDGGDIATASAEVDELVKTGTWNHYEDSRLHLLQYELCKASNDTACMLNSLRRASSEDGVNLGPALYRSVLELTAALEIRSELYLDAFATIARRNARKPKLEPGDPLLKAAETIRDLIHGPNALAFSGKVGFRSGCAVGEPNWRHQLLRREFAVDPGEGKLDKLEVRCDWRRITDVISPDKAWIVPTEWGNCQVFIFGDPDATFRLVEYPLMATESAADRPRAAID